MMKQMIHVLTDFNLTSTPPIHSGWNYLVVWNNKWNVSWYKVSWWGVCTNVAIAFCRVMKRPAWAFPSAPSWTEQHHSWPNSRNHSSHTLWDHCATPMTPPASYLGDGWSPTQRQKSQRSQRMRTKMRRIRQKRTRPPAQKHHVSSSATQVVTQAWSGRYKKVGLNVWFVCFCTFISAVDSQFWLWNTDQKV